jgi:curli biogenesis system outer membrane secretion channel CsgG
MRCWRPFFLLVLLVALLPAGRLFAGEPGMSVLLVAGGSVPGQSLSADEQAAVLTHVEAAAERLLKEQFGLRLQDDETMRKVRADAEKWAALTTGDIAVVRQTLETLQPDAVVRVSVHTSGIVETTTDNALAGKTRFFGMSAAGVTLEVVFKDKGRAARQVMTVPLATPVNGLKPLETALAAFDQALASLPAAIKADGLFGSAAVPVPLPELAKSLKDKKILFLATGTLDGIADAAALRQASLQVEAQLGGRLADLFSMARFDEETLAKARKNAEQWAVISGADIDKLREVLKPYAIDYCLRARWHASGSHEVKTEAGDATMYSGTATVTLEVIDLLADRGTKALVVESPPLATNENPAVPALEPFEAAAGALDVASRLLVGRLTAPAAAPATGVAPAVPGLPTVAVLWVKADFKPWRVPRLRQAILTQKHQREVNEFVDECRKTDRLGLQVSHYLLQGIMAGGRFLPVEEAGQRREDLAAIKNKLLELRMAGWVGKKLPYDQPVAAAEGVGADYVVTARITELDEVSAGSGSLAALASYAKSSTTAKVEVTITETKTGKAKTVKGEGSMSKEGWSTLVKITPELDLDQTLVGGAIKDALLKAAAQLAP